MVVRVCWFGCMISDHLVEESQRALWNQNLVGSSRGLAATPAEGDDVAENNEEDGPASSKANTRHGPLRLCVNHTVPISFALFKRAIRRTDRFTST